MGETFIAVDLDETRLERARQLGADVMVRSGAENVTERVMELTQGAGVDVAMAAHDVFSRAAETGALKVVLKQ